MGRGLCEGAGPSECCGLSQALPPSSNPPMAPPNAGLPAANQKEGGGGNATSAGADWSRRRAGRCDWLRAARPAGVSGRQRKREKPMCQAVGGANLNIHDCISMHGGPTLFTHKFLHGLDNFGLFFSSRFCISFYFWCFSEHFSILSSYFHAGLLNIASNKRST